LVIPAQAAVGQAYGPERSRIRIQITFSTMPGRLDARLRGHDGKNFLIVQLIKNLGSFSLFNRFSGINSPVGLLAV
jgi:hypothetical protein